jgi:TonB family protein
MMWRCLARDSGPVRCEITTLRTRKRIGIGLVFFILGGLCAVRAQSASEYQVKAAYLYNFAKSAAWPEESLPSGSSPFVIGVVGGDDEFIDTLEKTVAEKSVGTHPITVKRTNSIADMDLCRLIFFRSSAGKKRAEAAIAALANANILLVGEEENFLQLGGMINLELKNGKIRFEVNQESLDAAKIVLSPQILALAILEQSPPHAATDSGPVAESRQLKVGPLPEYPELAQKMNLKGAAQVEATVRRDGTVKEVRVIGGHPLLADALVKAVKEWRYAPAPEESRVVVRYVFGQ